MIDIDLLATTRRELAATRRRAAAARARTVATWGTPALTALAIAVAAVLLVRAEHRLAGRLAAERQLRDTAAGDLRLPAIAHEGLADARPVLGSARLLAWLEETMPGELWLDRVRLGHHELAIEGRGRELSALVDWVERLSASPLGNRPLELVDVRHASPGAGEAPPAFAFSLQSAPVRQPQPGEARPVRAARK